MLGEYFSMSDANRCFLDALGRYEKPLIRFAMGYTGDVHDARDVVQDVFMKLSQHIESIEPARLAPWLFTTCKNRALDLYRKNSRVVAMETETLDAEPSAVPDPVEQIEASETTRMLHRMIHDLPVKQRQAVWLKFVVGLGYQEISQIMSTSTGNVGYLIHHGVSALRERWQSLEAVH